MKKQNYEPAKILIFILSMILFAIIVGFSINEIAIFNVNYDFYFLIFPIIIIFITGDDFLELLVDLTLAFSERKKWKYRNTENFGLIIIGIGLIIFVGSLAIAFFQWALWDLLITWGLLIGFIILGVFLLLIGTYLFNRIEENEPRDSLEEYCRKFKSEIDKSEMDYKMEMTKELPPLKTTPEINEAFRIAMKKIFVEKTDDTKKEDLGYYEERDVTLGSDGKPIYHTKKIFNKEKKKSLDLHEIDLGYCPDCKEFFWDFGEVSCPNKCGSKYELIQFREIEKIPIKETSITEDLETWFASLGEDHEDFKNPLVIEWKKYLNAKTDLKEIHNDLKVRIREAIIAGDEKILDTITKVELGIITKTIPLIIPKPHTPLDKWIIDRNTHLYCESCGKKLDGYDHMRQCSSCAQKTNL